jgi:hypothetical protein
MEYRVGFFLAGTILAAILAQVFKTVAGKMVDLVWVKLCQWVEKVLTS